MNDKIRILIVEDNTIVAEDIKVRVERMGYHVTDCVTRGETAIKSVDKNTPDLILMDIKLKGDLNGIETSSSIHASRHDIPVIYLTAYADEETLERAKRTEPFGYIVKPFEDKDLRSAIEIAVYKHQMERKLKVSEEWLRTTLSSIGDGTIATDMKGCVTFMNPVAESLTGWSQSEAYGKPLTVVFNIINEQTRIPCENPVAKVIETGQIIGLANHTLLITRDGRELPIKDSASPILLNGTDSMGVVLVFQDDSEARAAERKLREKEKKLRSTLDATPFPVAVVDLKDDRIFYWSSSALELFGHTALTTSEWYQIAYPDPDYRQDMIDRWKPFLEIARESRHPVNTGEHQITCKDGSVKICELYASFIQDNLIVTFNNITERKQAEDNLREAILQQNITIKAGNIGLWDWDLITNKVSYSAEWKKQIGYEDNEIADNFDEWKSRVHPDDLESALERVQKSIANLNQDHKSEFRFRHRDGSYHWILAQASILQDESGQAIRMLGSHVDISERKTSEEELKKQRDLFELVINSVPARIFWKDLNLVYLGCNIHFVKDSGMKKSEDVIGKDDYVLVWKKDADEYRADDKLVISTGKPKLNYEEGFLDSEGKKVWWMTSKMPLRSSDGKIIGIIAISENITERKKAKKDKTILESKLQQAQKMESIGTLAGGIAHDFNNILSSIIGFSELALGDAEKGTDLEDDLQEIRNAGLRAKDLVKQILTFARQTDEEVKPIQVNVITFEVLKFIKSSIPSTIQINDKIESDSLIMGSPTQIHQVLMNLCTNAAYAMEENGGILEISVNDTMIDMMAMIPNLRPGDYIEIKVTDTGMGISPQHIHTIFEPYFTTKPVGEGTGMGLAVVHGIVESYGGKILVNSTIGQGTCFTIYLPITKKRKVHTHSAKKDLPLGTENILFVDDEAPIAKMGSKVLEQIGYSVTTRTSSVEALELFRSKPQAFDLVITDMTMPNMTGDKMAAKMMKIRSDIPVVLCTGYSKKISKESAADIGIKALVYKPVVKADLAKTVRKVLDEVNRTE